MTAAMVFAAGFGTRMRPLTDDRPKALVEVAGRPLIDHALDQVAGAAPIVVNAHHRAGQLRAHLADRGLHLIEETPRPLETGGGLRNALGLLGPDPVITMNADAVWTGPRAIDTLRAAWEDGMEGLLLLVPAARALSHAGRDFARMPDGRVTRDVRDMAYTGAGLIRTERLLGMAAGAFSLWELWRPMLGAGTLHAVEHPGHWADVGTPAGIGAAEHMLRAAA
jgi:MurNAc alpha-1-phosphate uridylyltransferase